MNGKEIYFEQLKPLIDDFNDKTGGIEHKMTKEIINDTMGSIIPIVKSVSKYVKSKDYKEDLYLEGIYEAYIKNPGISIKTVNKQKVGSFLFDINSYVRINTGE